MPAYERRERAHSARSLSAVDLAMPDLYSYDRAVTKPSLSSDSSLTGQGNTHASGAYASLFYEPAKSIREQFVLLMSPGASYFECRLEAQSSPDFLCHQPQVTVAGSNHSTPLLRPSSSPLQVCDDVPEPIQTVYHQTWASQHTHGLDSYLPPQQHSLLQIPELPQHDTLLSYLPTVPRQLSSPHHDQEMSSILQISDQLSACTITCDNRRFHSLASTPGPSYSSGSRTNENPNTLSSGANHCVGTHARRPSSKRQQLNRKPATACLFCRTHKIACRATLPGSIGKACSQCQRRSLRYKFPAESRQGMRKERVPMKYDQIASPGILFS